MRIIYDKLKWHSLFLKIFVVMVVSIVGVTMLTSWLTINMTTNLFMKTFGITNSKVVNQVKTNFETFNYSVVTTAGKLQQSGSIKSFLTGPEVDSVTTSRMYYDISQQVKMFGSVLDSYSVGIKILGVNGRSYSTNSNIAPPMSDNELKRHAITNTAQAEPKRLIYQYSNSSLNPDYHGKPLIIATKALMERSTGVVYGTMYVTMFERDFKQLYNNMTSEGNDIALLDASGVIVSSNREDWIGQTDASLMGIAQKIVTEQIDSLNVDVMGQDSIVLTEDLPGFGYYLVNVIDKEAAMGQILDHKAVTLITTAIVILALIIVFLITRKITKSLTMLVRQMSGVTRNNFDNYVTIKGSYEVSELGDAYNYMLDEIHDYVDKLVETQKEQRNAELAALQRQINPHFLYNTLASIKILVQQGSKEKATETIHALIVLMQNAIGNISETNSIEEELVILKSYVLINQVRYGERIRVYYFISPDCLEYQVPKLIIQPFIENAFFHAFNKKGEGTIQVMVHKEADALICEVNDNGDGMELATDHQGLPYMRGKRQLFSGIGIKNVHSRIGLLYGDEYGVTISSQLGEGTKVKIRLPLSIKDIH